MCESCKPERSFMFMDDFEGTAPLAGEYARRRYRSLQLAMNFNLGVDEDLQAVLDRAEKIDRFMRGEPVLPESSPSPSQP